MPDDAFEMTVKLTRGRNASDRDTQKVKVSADTITELRDRVEELQDEMEEWAVQWRSIQPDEQRSVPEDQRELGEVDA